MSFSKYMQSLNEAKEIKSFSDYDEFVANRIQEKIEEYYKSPNYYTKSEVLRWAHTGNRFYNEDQTMKEYKDKGSNPVRLASSTKDILKVLYRLQWCKNKWPEAVEAYHDRAAEIIYEENKSDIDRLANNDRIKAEEEARKAAAEKERFETEVAAADTSKFAPTERDWQKMIDYMNKKSNPTRLADSCKDANKVVARYIIAKALNWEEAVKEFGRRAKALSVATDAELEAYARKFALTNIPDQWKDYIEMLAMEDTKGGIALHQEGNNASLKLPLYIRKALDSCNEVASYSIVNDIYNNGYVIKVELYDHPDCYVVFAEDVNHKETIYRRSRLRGSYSSLKYVRKAGKIGIFDHEPTDEEIKGTDGFTYCDSKQEMADILKMKLS